uniref:Uncharacterized protein n=1 Tax=Anguilla anguilla TaxID=7936 RepID=A0A0E9VXK0_ANGAN
MTWEKNPSKKLKNLTMKQQLHKILSELI